MALILPKSVFIHIPRTGGTWTRNAIKTLNIPFHESSKKAIRTTHAYLSDCVSETDGKFTWAFVRNPFTYLKSLWIQEWYPGLSVPRYDLNRKKFHEFVELYLEHHPGYVTERYRKFLEVDGKYPAVDFVGRLENINEDFPKALELAGEEFDPELIKGLKPKNTSNEDRYLQRRNDCEYRTDLRKRIIESEKEVFDMFYKEDL